MTTAVKERGILMHARSVLNILAGRKTQTRRIIKPQPVMTYPGDGDFEPGYVDWRGPIYCCNSWEDFPEYALLRCPLGVPGDRLWVREAWQALWFEEAYSEGFGLGYADDLGEADLEKCRAYLTSGARETWRKCEPFGVVYRADSGWDEHKDDRGFNWRPSLFMPRWASRITLEIVSVRVERVQDISDADALAEGVDGECELICSEGCGHRDHEGPHLKTWTDADDNGFLCPKCPERLWHHPIEEHHRQGFIRLWNDTNGKGAWERNDWCWCIEFKVLGREGRNGAR